jgi:predicted DCC family thiol-disulfide oxidoreductase YuxK
MKRLYVFYDGECALCCRLRIWLAQQPVFVPLTFIPLQSSEVAPQFPGIERFHPEERLVVISDAGELWRGESAWITVLWALREYREWAQRLAHPALRPFARRACALISENRHGLSRWLRGASRNEVRERLATVADSSCDNDQPSTTDRLCHRP